MSENIAERIIQKTLEKMYGSLMRNAELLSGPDGKLVREIMIPVTTKYGKARGKRLISNSNGGGYDATFSKEGEYEINFRIVNRSTDPSYPNYPFAKIVEEGRPPVNKFKGTRKKDPFYKALDQWKSSAGFAGSTFWLAVSINEKGIAPSPELFDEIRKKTTELILKSGFVIID